MQSIEPAVTQAVYDVLDIDSSVASRNCHGGTAPERVRTAVAAARERYLR
jgi:argininosuccinate lyase